MGKLKTLHGTLDFPHLLIKKTCPCNIYPLIPHFYIAKLGYAGVYLFFLFLLQTIDCGYLLEAEAVLTCTHNLWFEQNKKTIKNFLLKISIFYNFKNLCILHGKVFVKLPETVVKCVSFRKLLPMKYTEIFFQPLTLKISLGKIWYFQYICSKLSVHVRTQNFEREVFFYHFSNFPLFLFVKLSRL